VALKDLARRFSQSKRVAVEVFELPYAALYDAEMAAVAAQRPGYDVVMVDDPWLPALIGEDEDGDRQRLERLEFAPAECARLQIDDFVATTLEVSVHPDNTKSAARTRERDQQRRVGCDDGLYALPFVGNSQLFLTREATEATTWGNVIDRTVATEATDAGYIARVGAGNSIVTDFMPILWSQSPPRRAEAESLASLPQRGSDPFPLGPREALESFQFVRKLGAHKRANRGVVSADDFDLAIHLVDKNASMTIAWSAWVMALARLPRPAGINGLDLDRDGEADFQVTQIPGGNPVLGAWLLAIPARTPQLDLAREFLLFSTEKAQTDLSARLGNPPARKSTLKDAALVAMYPSFPQQLDSLRQARARPRTPHWREIENILGECLTAVYENAVEPDVAWRRVNRRLDVIRDKQNRMDSARTTSDTAVRVRIRAILDEPSARFSCLQGDVVDDTPAASEVQPD
jgi:hypothetical protein